MKQLSAVADEPSASLVQVAALQQHLHVQKAWVRKHVPSVLSLCAGSLTLTDGGKATRTIEALVLSPLDEQTESTHTGVVTYDVPPAGENAGTSGELTVTADERRRASVLSTRSAWLSIEL